MTKRSVKRTVKIIDPMFHIPEGVDELQYNEPEITATEEYGVESVDLAVEYEGDTVGYEGTEDNSDVPPSPDILSITQTLRRLPSGEAVVDVVLTVEGDPEYEVHITKA